MPIYFTCLLPTPLPSYSTSISLSSFHSEALYLSLAASAGVHCGLRVRALLAVSILSLISCDLWARWKEWIRKSEWKQRGRKERGKRRSSSSWWIWLWSSQDTYQRENERDWCVTQDTFASLNLLYLLQFSSILFLVSHPPPTPPLLSLLGYPPSSPLSFPSMYIFRSRVIKSAPEGMCRNRISLILPCPHRTTKTQIHTNPDSLSFFLLLIHLSIFINTLRITHGIRIDTSSACWSAYKWDNSLIHYLRCSILKLSHTCLSLMFRA